MKIYLPLKDDLLDHGDANSTWVATTGTLPVIKQVGGLTCAEFLGKNQMNIKSTSLISNLTVWTLQFWFYPYTDGTDTIRYIVSNYTVGASSNKSNIFIGLYKQKVYFNSIYTVNNILVNTWHQVYMTCDGADIDFYIDTESKQTISRQNIGFTNGLSIGNECSGRTDWDMRYKGGIAQFCLTDKYNDERLGLSDKIIYLSENKEVYGMV